jgi:hypothetical protein
MKQQLTNLALFKLGWLACVLFAVAGQPVWSAASVAAVAVLHLLSVPIATKEAILLAAAAVIGLAWESALVATGMVTYPAAAGASSMAPYWIVAMWVLFATTINHGLRWIKKSWAIAMAAGAVGGPLAFYSGAAMGAVEFGNTPLALAVIGAGWAVLLPLLVLISDTIIDSEWLEPGLNEAKSVEKRLALSVLGRQI